MARVGVVIVSFNSGALLERCLAALSDQTLQADRILVMDNHSTDPATLSLLESLSVVEVEFLPENLGYGGAINRAAAMMPDMDYLCCLNPDAFPTPRFLETLMNAASARPEFGSFAPLMLDAQNPDLIDGAGDILHISGIPWRRYHGAADSSVMLKQEPVFSPCAGAALYEMNAFRAVGGFDESFFMYVEDVDLGFRLQLAGYPCLLVPEARVLHIGSATTGRTSDFTVYHGHRNLVLNYFKNMPALLLLLTLPLHLIATLLTIMVFTVRGQGRTILKAKWDALCALPSVIAKRNNQSVKQGAGVIWHLLEKWSMRKVVFKPLSKNPD